MGLAGSHINEPQLETNESRSLFFMISLQYHRILGLAEIKTLHPRENKRYAPDIIILKMRSNVKFKVTVTRKWYTTLHHPKMHGIPISKNMRYVLDMIILQSRSEVKVKVTRNWYATLCHPKMHKTHQIWNSYLKEYKRYAPDTIILKARSEVKVTVTGKWYVTFCHPKMHVQTKFGIPISKNIGDMHQTQCSFWKLGQRSSSRSQ